VQFPKPWYEGQEGTLAAAEVASHLANRRKSNYRLGWRVGLPETPSQITGHDEAKQSDAQEPPH
jgi:hypothetical protein